MIISKKKSEQVAEILLNINAVKLQPSNFFTWTSGKKSPIYCDNRLLLSYVKERKVIRDFFCEYIADKYSNIDYIAGVATGAIPHGMMVADKLELPFVYIRPEAKKHGRKNQIEGELKPESNVIVIEDLISTGKSSMKAIEAVEQSGSKVIELISIFTYEFVDQNKLKRPYFSLCNYSTLIEFAIKKNMINKNDKDILFKWQKKASN
ncbi:MAG: orotate phosphoribosyltransferase [Flavobacteriales bacterium]|nr:orotate phosphoribosyltransferase [Flavobacteriales bacterium]